jgi:hypothetical protein
VFVYINNQRAVRAFSMDISKKLSYERTWSEVRPDYAGLPGTASAYMLAANPPRQGRLTDAEREDTARQLAIWFYTNKLVLDSTTVRDPTTLARARELVELTSDPPTQVEGRATKLGITTLVRAADARRVTVEVALNTGDDVVFNKEHALDVRIEGRQARITTAKQTDIHQKRSGKELPIEVTGNAPDNNTALMRLDRVDTVTRITFFWKIDTLPGGIFVPDGEAPPLITAGMADDILFAQTVNLDPATFPTAQALLDRFLIGTLGHLPGWLLIPAILGLFYLVSKFGPFVEWIARKCKPGVGWVWSRINRQLFDRRRKAAAATTPDKDRPHNPETG